MLKFIPIVILILLLASTQNSVLAAPDNAQSLYQKSTASFNAKDYDQALDYIEEAEQQQTNNAEFYLHHARVYSKLMNGAGIFSISGYIKGMRSNLEKVVQLKPKHIKAKQLLVELYSTIPGSLGGDKQKALQLAEQLSQQDPVEGHIAHASIHSHNENYVEAIKLLQTILQLAPDRHHVIYDLAILLEKNKQNKAAIEQYLIFADKKTAPEKSTAALWRVSTIAIDNEQHFAAGEQAMKSYIDLLESDKEKQGKGYLQLAHLYQMQDKTTAAKSTLTTAQKALAGNQKWQKKIRKKLKQL